MPLTFRPHPVLIASVAAILVGASEARALADDAACINAVEQSLTLRQKGHLHDALKTLAVCADPGCPAELRTECTQRIDSIGLAMPTLVLGAKDGAGNDLYDVKVTMDGAPLLTSLDGRPVAIDPGEHVFLFETVGQPPLEKKLVLREGEKNRPESVVLGPVAAAPTTATAALAPPSPPMASSWSTRKTLAIGSGVVGLVGVGLGIAWGEYASSAQSKEKVDCGSSGCPNRPQGNEDYNTAQKDATGSTIAISLGAAFIATGAVLWLTAPSNGSATVQAARGLRVVPAVMRSGGALVVGGDL
jgi:hypothetical protein